MMKKKLVITGTGSGLGRAISDHFSSEYEVIRVSSNKGDLVGSLASEEFRQEILKLEPAIFINNAALFPNSENLVESYSINLLAAIQLAEGFAKKKTTEQIINMSSISGRYKTWQVGWNELHYRTQKNALSDFTQSYYLSGLKKTRMTAVELGYVNTDFANTSSKALNKEGVFGIPNFPPPMSVDKVISLISYILNQPQDINIGLIQATSFFRET